MNKKDEKTETHLCGDDSLHSMMSFDHPHDHDEPVGDGEPGDEVCSGVRGSGVYSQDGLRGLVASRVRLSITESLIHCHCENKYQGK